MQDVLLAASLGGLVAFFLSLPAVWLERLEWKRADAAKTTHHRFVFSAAILLHVVLGSGYGAAYALFVERDWLFVTRAPYSIESLLLFACATWFVVSMCVFPVLGFGFFGLKAGKRLWLETFMSHLLVGLCVWSLIQWYQPAYF